MTMLRLPSAFLPLTITGTLRTREQRRTVDKPESTKVLQTSLRNRIAFESTPSATKPSEEKINIESGIHSLEFTTKGKSGKVTLYQNKEPVITITMAGKKSQTCTSPVSGIVSAQCETKKQEKSGVSSPKGSFKEYALQRWK